MRINQLYWALILFCWYGIIVKIYKSQREKKNRMEQVNTYSMRMINHNIGLAAVSLIVAAFVANMWLSSFREVYQLLSEEHIESIWMLFDYEILDGIGYDYLQQEMYSEYFSVIHYVRNSVNQLFLMSTMLSSAIFSLYKGIQTNEILEEGIFIYNDEELIAWHEIKEYSWETIKERHSLRDEAAYYKLILSYKQHRPKNWVIKDKEGTVTLKIRREDQEVVAQLINVIADKEKKASAPLEK